MGGRLVLIRVLDDYSDCQANLFFQKRNPRKEEVDYTPVDLIHSKAILKLMGPASPYDRQIGPIFCPTSIAFWIFSCATHLILSNFSWSFVNAVGSQKRENCFIIDVA
jgi:hypothetical protein